LRRGADRNYALKEFSGKPVAVESKKGGIVRRIVGFFFAIAALALASAPAHSDDYPSRRITLIAPWPPAGAIDVICRELAPGVGDLLGQPVVVENRPGAGSTIGTADGAKAMPDGYTLVLAGSGSMAISPTLYKELPYDPRRDSRQSRLLSAFRSSSWSIRRYRLNQSPI
jgi:tripartite-type tricarboxylate transporter receptor subunit TctC